jgi:hypothetical protein
LHMKLFKFFSFFLSFFFFLLRDRGEDRVFLLCSPSWPQTCNLPISASGVLRLQVCTPQIDMIWCKLLHVIMVRMPRLQNTERILKVGVERC